MGDNDLVRGTFWCHPCHTGTHNPILCMLGSWGSGGSDKALCFHLCLWLHRDLNLVFQQLHTTFLVVPPGPTKPKELWQGIKSVALSLSLSFCLLSGVFRFHGEWLLLCLSCHHCTPIARTEWVLKVLVK
jgi:hypothetical protein